MIGLHRKNFIAGFTLIELAIVLSIVGIVAGGLWRLSANSNQQTKDQITAQQQLTLINAVRGFLNDTTPTTGGQAWLVDPVLFPTGTTVANLSILVTCPAAAGTYFTTLCNYLPPGFTNAGGTYANPYGQSYKVQVMQGPGTAPTQNYTFMIMTSGGNTISDADGGRISSLIGGEGGFLYTSPVCSTAAAAHTTACGAEGAWTIGTATYSFTAAASVSGHVASLSSAVSSVGNNTTNISPEWLARHQLPTDPTATPYFSNTMQTDIFMGDQLAGETAGAHPSIHLHNGYIEGNGVANTGPTTYTAQLNLVQLYDPTASNQPIVANFAAGCSQLQYPTLTDPGVCPRAVNVTGDIGLSGEVTAAKLYSSSDVRLKTNITPIHDALSNIMRLNPVTYAFKAGGSKGMGVVAQDLEKVYPELVTNSHGTKYVDYSGLTGPLIGAIQDLKKQNDDLRKQLKQQELRQERLEKQINAERSLTP